VEELNLATLPKYLVDEAASWELLERLRWGSLGGKQVCPHCGVIGEHYFLNAKSGQRTTSTGKVSYRRLWKCRDKDCRKQFSVLVGTIFESSKVPVHKWLLALWLTSAGKNGVSAKELERHLGVAYQTAWFMSHRLKEAMRAEPVASLMAGTIVADETYVGGKPKNRHQQGRPSRLPGGGGSATGGKRDKTPVVALIDKETGEARARVVTSVTSDSLRSVLTSEVDIANSHLRTDGGGGYRKIGQEFLSHEYVDHSAYEYVRYSDDGEVITSNIAESYFARLKRMIGGTWHNVSPEHLGRYVDEVSFRWNTRKASDHDRVVALVAGAAGKRLTYRPAVEG
jgi:transposase-like protein